MRARNQEPKVTCLQFYSIWYFYYYDNQKGLIVMHIIKNLRLPVYNSIPNGVIIFMMIRKVWIVMHIIKELRLPVNSSILNGVFIVACFIC